MIKKEDFDPKEVKFIAVITDDNYAFRKYVQSKENMGDIIHEQTRAFRGYPDNSIIILNHTAYVFVSCLADINGIEFHDYIELPDHCINGIELALIYNKILI